MYLFSGVAFAQSLMTVRGYLRYIAVPTGRSPISSMGHGPIHPIDFRHFWFHFMVVLGRGTKVVSRCLPSGDCRVHHLSYQQVICLNVSHCCWRRSSSAVSAAVAPRISVGLRSYPEQRPRLGTIQMGGLEPRPFR